MKRIVSILFLIISVYSNGQTICGTANEGGSVTLTAPAGNVIISIDFASYGTPGGSCGSFTIGACHAANSESICSATFVGQNSATINANNAVFGDPCVGTGKRLYVQATYGSTLPLTLIAFSAKKIDKDKVMLSWTTAHESNTLEFKIERSINGVLFESAGLVAAIGRNSNNYSYTDLAPGTAPAFYYRLKMIDQDGKYQYSNIIRVNYKNEEEGLLVFPNPAGDHISITSISHQEAIIVNTTGQLVKKIDLIPGIQTINLQSWRPGMYFIKAGEKSIKFVKTGF